MCEETKLTVYEGSQKYINSCLTKNLKNMFSFLKESDGFFASVS